MKNIEALETLELFRKYSFRKYKEGMYICQIELPIFGGFSNAEPRPLAEAVAEAIAKVKEALLSGEVDVRDAELRELKYLRGRLM